MEHWESPFAAVFIWFFLLKSTLYISFERCHINKYSIIIVISYPGTLNSVSRAQVQSLLVWRQFYSRTTLYCVSPLCRWDRSTLLSAPPRTCRLRAARTAAAPTLWSGRWARLPTRYWLRPRWTTPPEGGAAGGRSRVVSLETPTGPETDAGDRFIYGTATHYVQCILKTKAISRYVKLNLIKNHQFSQ